MPGGRTRSFIQSYHEHECATQSCRTERVLQQGALSGVPSEHCVRMDWPRHVAFNDPGFGVRERGDKLKRLHIHVSDAHVTGNGDDFAVPVAISQLLQRPDKTSACVVAARLQRAPAQPGASEEGPSAAQAALSKALDESG